jgi:hypothetical protein
MSARLLNLSLVILLLATAAFLIDVISPYTPTPTASSVAKVAFVLLFLLQARHSVNWSECFGAELRVTQLNVCSATGSTYVNCDDLLSPLLDLPATKIVANSEYCRKASSNVVEEQLREGFRFVTATFCVAVSGSGNQKWRRQWMLQQYLFYVWLWAL